MAAGAQLVFLLALCSVIGRLHGWIPSYAYDEEGRDPQPAAEDETKRVPSTPDTATPNLEAKFKGRCNDFLGPSRSAVDYVKGDLKQKDCDGLWLKFLKGFQHKVEGKVKTSDYDEFFKAIESVIVPKDKTAFYSGGGVRAFFEQNLPSKTKLHNIETTFPGYVMNGIVFCGDPSTKTNGIGAVCGPRHKSLEGSAWYSFWQRNSEEFAKKATGKAHVILSTEFPKVYVPVTMFSKYEVKTLQKNPKVTSLDLLLLRMENDLTPPESCAPGGSIASLKTDAGPTLGKAFQCNLKPKDLQPLVKPRPKPVFKPPPTPPKKG